MKHQDALGRTWMLQDWRVSGLPVHGRIRCCGYSANCGKSKAFGVEWNSTAWAFRDLLTSVIGGSLFPHLTFWWALAYVFLCLQTQGFLCYRLPGMVKRWSKFTILVGPTKPCSKNLYQFTPPQECICAHVATTLSSLRTIKLFSVYWASVWERNVFGSINSRITSQFKSRPHC